MRGRLDAEGLVLLVAASALVACNALVGLRDDLRFGEGESDAGDERALAPEDGEAPPRGEADADAGHERSDAPDAVADGSGDSPSDRASPDAADACARNACGGCAVLVAKPGDPCCGGTYRCDGEDALSCSGSGANACGGCTTLAQAPGTSCGGKCGTATYACSGPEATACVDPVTTPGPGAPCGACGTLRTACSADGRTTECPGDDRNACGGCAPLAKLPGAPCGTCGTAKLVCAADRNSTVCPPDRNACGGCAPLDRTPGAPCGTCRTLKVACSADGESAACPGDDVSLCGSCGPTGLSCGGTSCCDARPVPAGTFPLGRSAAGTDACPAGLSCLPDEQPEMTATVSAFRLDTFEVTVGRFRNFVEAYPASLPASGAGAHPKISGSGWDPAWTSNLPSTQSHLLSSLDGCVSTNKTWTASAGANENKPINCVRWYLAFAFCAWDGGRLPTEAEWEYAAAGGAENRLFPWGSAPADCSRATLRGCGGVKDVGNTPAGAGRFGHHDLAGNVYEWVLDAYDVYPSGPCVDCARLTSPSGERSLRGGALIWSQTYLRAARRDSASPVSTGFENSVGFRCARP